MPPVKVEEPVTASEVIAWILGVLSIITIVGLSILKVYRAKFNQYEEVN